MSERGRRFPSIWRSNRGPAALSNVAHGVKGLCRNIGAHRLADITVYLESHASDSIEVTKDSLMGLKSELQAIDLSLPNSSSQSTGV